MSRSRDSAPKCGQKKRQGDRGPCKRPAGWGTDHFGVGACKLHGGMAPSGRAAGQRNLRRKVMEDAVRTYGLPIDIDPGSALLEEVSRTAGHVRWLHDIVAGMDPEALIWGDKQTSHVEGVGPEGPVDQVTQVQSAGVHIWLELYLKEREHLRKVCTDALKAGIAERQVQLAEQAGERAGQWLQATLSVLDLSDEVMRRVLANGVRHLHLLEGTG